ncbi:ribonuclease HI [Nocardioides bruguierae]|uniref:Ribonuclease H n=1 Tax=Nocardioides bruguierae TaxID=2945102 RepID=A0A9X2IFS1_9ACTN|nr:ribonuclease HI [Nocardioides bruguierae]MCL8025151.1 ribonuclease HI [Nocardioides bruguierae]MCM0620035.1 ribonuclease HI [Nocardioides bruguierae]
MSETSPHPDDVVTVHTDGSCAPNPGPGGWGALLRQGSHVKELCGGEPGTTTNNRMELMAPIMALRALKRPCRVEIYTDSSYVRGGITSWMRSWKKNGWKTSAKQPVKNEDLWRELDEECGRHEVNWHWVKGHAGDAGNEAADRLANRGREEAVRGA